MQPSTFEQQINDVEKQKRSHRRKPKSVGNLHSRINEKLEKAKVEVAKYEKLLNLLEDNLDLEESLEEFL